MLVKEFINFLLVLFFMMMMVFMLFAKNMINTIDYKQSELTTIIK